MCTEVEKLQCFECCPEPSDNSLSFCGWNICFDALGTQMLIIIIILCMCE